MTNWTRYNAKVSHMKSHREAEFQRAMDEVLRSPKPSVYAIERLRERGEKLAKIVSVGRR